ncbi:hypothetical protein FPRO03_02366 [Fusarium proliferatum]|nr:hypothetical protein FPRO03_02366 [Fusarium proliferatum]
MLPPVKSIMLAEDEATNSTLQYVKENPGSIMAMGLGAGMVTAPGLVVAPAISAAGFTTESVSAGSLAAGIQSVNEDVVSNSAFAICQSYATGGLGTAAIHGFVRGTGIGVGLGSIFPQWKHDELANRGGVCFFKTSEPLGTRSMIGDDQSPTRKMQLLQNMTSTAMIATGAVLAIAPAVAVTPVLAGLGFGAGGIVAAAAGIQSGIGSVVAGSAFATLQSAGAGGFGLAVVNGVVQAAGVVVGGSGVATKLKGQGNGDNDNGDQEETDGTHDGNDAEEMNDQQKGVASLSPEDDNKPNGEGEGEVLQSHVERELMRFRRLKDDFFRPAAAAVVEEPKAPRRDRNFKRLCRKFRKGYCRRGASCDFYHFVPWEMPGREYTDHPVDLYFANFKGFDHQRQRPFFDEFYRMCDHFGWSDDEATEPWYNFRIALVQEFNYVFGEDEENLQNWKKMFKIIGLSEPTSLSEAHTVMRPTRVNLVDMLQSSRTGEPVQRFETLRGLSVYSYSGGEVLDDGDVFPEHKDLHKDEDFYKKKAHPRRQDLS